MVGYTKGAKEVDESSPECYARRTEATNPIDIQYFVRIDRTNAGACFDPDSLLTTNSSRASAKVNGTWDKYPFVQVNKDAFDLYLRFLKTTNRNYLVQANRASKL